MAETQTAPPEETAAAAPGPDPELATRLKAELAALHLKLPTCKTVHDYQVLTEQVHNVTKAAAAACRRRAQLQAAPGPDAAAPSADAVPAAPAAAAAAAAAAAGGRNSFAANSVLGLLPAADDGVTCLLVRLPKGWGTARLQAFIERFSVKPSRVDKAAGDTHSLVAFAAPEDRTRFVEEFDKASHDKSSVAGVQCAIKLPPKPGSRQQQQQQGEEAGTAGEDGGGDAVGGAGSKRAAPRQQQQRGGPPAKQARVDIREVVCPWWSRPYKQQLSDKLATVKEALKSLTDKVSSTHSRGTAPRPPWLVAALARPGRAAVLLPGIARSPQLNGYRNKAEFTLGLDGAERPAAGFLLGAFVEGETRVADPSDCRHISPTCRAYAAIMTSFLRSSSNSLPVWDKRKNKGFWRLLVVREGRSPTFLPLPLPAAAAEGGGSSDGGVLPPCPLAEVPMGRWFVADPAAAAAKAPAAAAGGAGAADVEVTLEDMDTDTPAAAAPAAAGEAAAAAAAASSSEQQQQKVDGAVLDLTGGLELEEVTEAEPATPLPSQVMVMLQVDPTAAESPEQMQQQLQTLAAHLQQAAQQQGLPLTSLLVQHHSGVCNAAPATAQLMLCPGFDSSSPAAATASAAAAAGAGSAAAAAVNEAGSFNDSLCELTFRVSPMAFYQVNPGATCLLYHAAGRLAAAGPDTLLLDICCGTGTIGLTLAKQVAAVIGIDSVESAVQDAQRNAQLNGITNASFVCGRAEAVIDQVLAEHTPRFKHVVAVVDPPRAGLHRNVVMALLGCAAIQRVVYVSCNPSSLVSNGQFLCGAYKPEVPAGRAANKEGRGGRGGRQQHGGGATVRVAPYKPFRPTQVLAFDMFPHTAHVETLMLLER